MICRKQNAKLSLACGNGWESLHNKQACKLRQMMQLHYFDTLNDVTFDFIFGLTPAVQLNLFVILYILIIYIFKLLLLILWLVICDKLYFNFILCYDEAVTSQCRAGKLKEEDMDQSEAPAEVVKKVKRSTSIILSTEAQIANSGVENIVPTSSSAVLPTSHIVISEQSR